MRPALRSALTCIKISAGGKALTASAGSSAVTSGWAGVWVRRCRATGSRLVFGGAYGDGVLKQDCQTVVVVNHDVAKNLSTSTLKDDAYAFVFDQKGLMIGISIEGTKITRVSK